MTETEDITGAKYLAVTTADQELNISFSKEDNVKNVVTILRDKNGGVLTFNRAFVSTISEEAAMLVPEGLQIDVKYVVFITSQNPERTKVLFGVNFGAELDLSKLPLIGDQLPKDLSVGVDEFELLLGSEGFSQQEVAALNTIIPPETVVLPQTIAAGANYSMRVQIGGQKEYMSLAAAEKTSGSETIEEQDSSATQPVDRYQTREVTQPGMTMWMRVNKSFGPLTIKRAGGRFHDAKLHLMLDTQLKMGPITLTLEGLSAGSTIATFSPEFNLDGIGLSYEKAPIKISGSFLRHVDVAKDSKNESFSGAAIIKTASLTLSALGAYNDNDLDGTPSVFVYGVVNRAIGVGPPWFNVTGMSAGFGYNRTIKVPKVEQVHEFPLVRVAMRNSYGTDPMTVLGKMKKYIPSSPGKICLALGVRFNTFKLIESFALLLLNLTGKLKLDVIGMSTLKLPAKAKKPLAEIEIAYKANYDFDEHVLRVNGVLTPSSYVIDKKCRLTGSFAFYSWTEGDHAGDFVFSMGGYHPSFEKPAHYPTVPRLGLYWKINKYLTIKGNMYCAMVPSGMMAGGRLEALFKIKKEKKFELKVLGKKVAGVSLSGEVKAAFVAGADFIIAWLPYAYEAEMKVGVGIKVKFKGTAYVDLGVKTVKKSVHKSFDINLSTGLTLWGPEFAGVAHVDWKIVSFDIKFGDQKKPEKKSLSWNEFKEAFLPPADQMLTIAFEDGLIKTVEKTEDGLSKTISIVNPAELVISTNSTIPLTESSVVDKDGNSITLTGKSFGIASMDIPEVPESKQTIQILDVDNGDVDVSDQFILARLLKNAPKALWGSSFNAKPGKNHLVTGMLMGFRITPKPKKKSEVTEDKEVSDFSYDVEQKPDAFAWEASLSLTYDTGTDDQRRTILQGVNNQTETNQRKNILNALGLADLTSLDRISEDTTAAFLRAPEVVSI